MPGIVWSPPAEASDLYGFLFGATVPEDKMVAFGGRHLPEQAEGFGQRTGVIEQGVEPRGEMGGMRIAGPPLGRGVADSGQDNAGIVQAAVRSDEPREGRPHVSVALVRKIDHQHWKIMGSGFE